METFVLNNNTTIPALGLGTFTLTPDEPRSRSRRPFQTAIR